MPSRPGLLFCHVEDLDGRLNLSPACLASAGLAACASSGTGLQRIYDIKKRPAGLPLGICVAEVSDVDTYGVTSHLPPGLLHALLPGPVTVILPRQPDAPVSPLLNPGLPSLGTKCTAQPACCCCQRPLEA